jgi:hypothetical protein
MRIALLSVVGITLLVGCGSGSSGKPGVGTGSGGTGTGSGGTGGTGAPGSCGVTEAEPNNTRDTATAYTAGAAVVACIGADDDVDFYQFTAPEADVAGGYYAIAIDDVGAGYADLKMYAVSDNGEIDHEYTDSAGASLRAFLAAAPGQQYRITVGSFSGFDLPFKYTLKATYTKVVDSYEPNDTRATAKPITLGTPVTATLFAGYRSATLDPDEYQDFYTLTLAAGTVTAKLADIPSDVYGDLKVLDADGNEVDHSYSSTMGANVTITMKAVTAGVHFVRAGIFTAPPDGAGKGIMLPDHFTHPYTLTVQQP